MTADHASRAAELATEALSVDQGVLIRHISVASAQVHAMLALADAVTLGAEHVARRTSQATSQDASHFAAEQMMSDWHALSDHARDGEPFGGPLCNCERVVMRARGLGWGPTHNATHNATPNTTHNPVRRPRWDDDVAIAAAEGDSRTPVRVAPDHPEIVTERGQERPNGAGDVRADREPDAETGDDR